MPTIKYDPLTGQLRTVFDATAAPEGAFTKETFVGDGVTTDFTVAAMTLNDNFKVDIKDPIDISRAGQVVSITPAPDDGKVIEIIN